MRSRLRILGFMLVGAMFVFGAACSDDSANADDGADETATPTATSTDGPTSVPTEVATTDTGSASGGAAGGGIEPANPDAPPEGTLESSSGSVELGLGTYCWSPPTGSGNPAMCSDAIGIITGTSDLTVSAGETLTIAGEQGTLSWPPMTIDSATLWEAPAEPIEAQEDFRAWQPEGGFEGGTELDTDSSEIGAHTITLPDDLEPGRYLLSVFYTAGPDRGSDATYGAILVVE